MWIWISAVNLARSAPPLRGGRRIDFPKGDHRRPPVFVLRQRRERRERRDERGVMEEGGERGEGRGGGGGGGRR